MFRRRWSGYSGLYFDDFAPDSAWIREEGALRLPPLDQAQVLVIHGEYRPHPEARGLERGYPTLSVRGDGQASAVIAGVPTGLWQARVSLDAATAQSGAEIKLRLHGVGFTNFLAWLGRVTGWPSLQRFRQQRKNRQIRVTRLQTADGEILYDFSNRHTPLAPDFVRRHTHFGLNIVGFLTADLGVGESARCMVRAADAAGLPTTLIDLKLPCKNRRGDPTYAPRLRDQPAQTVNVMHLDPPASRDVDHHHGASLRAGRYNIGYWAWELPEFPDAWMRNFEFFDEIWCPSEFTRAAIGFKAPIPVITMPHAISFPRPAEPTATLRARFGLPPDAFLFLFAYDLNSYSERKNPRGAIEAFRRSQLAGRGAALVIKVHSTAGHESELSALRAAVADLPGTILIVETLSRADLYALQQACDCFVSLHRAEGFGLAVAEAMYLGKPVISTDWSATAEFVNATNGLPVRYRLITLDRHHGPYARGQTWADPDLDHAAEHMARIAADRPLQHTLGQAGQAAMEHHFAPSLIGARYRRRLETIALR